MAKQSIWQQKTKIDSNERTLLYSTQGQTMWFNIDLLLQCLIQIPRRSRPPVLFPLLFRCPSNTLVTLLQHSHNTLTVLSHYFCRTLVTLLFNVRMCVLIVPRRSRPPVIFPLLLRCPGSRWSWCYKRVLQWRYSGVTCMLKLCLVLQESVTRDCCKVVTRVSQECYKHMYNVLQEAWEWSVHPSNNRQYMRGLKQTCW